MTSEITVNDIEIGSIVRGMRVIDPNWSVSTEGEVVAIHDTAPLPGVDEPIAIIDEGDDEVPIRVRNIDTIITR